MPNILLRIRHMFGSCMMLEDVGISLCILGGVQDIYRSTLDKFLIIYFVYPTTYIVYDVFVLVAHTHGLVDPAHCLGHIKQFNDQLQRCKFTLFPEEEHQLSPDGTTDSYERG